MSSLLPLHGSGSVTRGYHIGPENRLIETAVRWILEESPRAVRETPWNPVTFYGPGGCGKTHIVSGIYQAWKERHPKSKPIFASGADFARGFAVAVETRTTDDFRKRIRKAPLWIVDRIEELKDKPAAEEELLLALDESVALENTVVFTANRFPGELTDVSPKIQARLIGGLTIPILPPGQKTRAAMIHEIAEQFRIPLTATAIAHFAKMLDLPYPMLHGTFTQIVGESGNRIPDANSIRQFLKRNSELTHPSLEEILKQTAKYLGLKQTDLKGKSRSSSLARGRAVAIYLARQLTDRSLKEIGKFFGGRDHKTIAHHCDETEQKLVEDSQLRSVIARIREQLASQPKKGC